GKLSAVAQEGLMIDRIGTVEFIGFPRSDAQGTTKTFVANMNDGSFAGIYRAISGIFRLYFPQIADGESAGVRWRTKLVLANRDTTPATATVYFYDDDGKPISVSSSGQTGDHFAFTIPSLGTTSILTDGVGSLRTGWAIVQTDQSLSGI